MLEKLGLPSKPSNRGAAWVVDASHCQGCSGQFTFINRKHHCRKCGGLFCGSCTQQRMILRGQGDSPVRICEPCKKLEEAARFELRYGHKTRAARGSMKHASTDEEEVLSQILGTDKNPASGFGNESHSDVFNNLQKSASSASSSRSIEESAAPVRDSGTLKSLSVGSHGNILNDMGSTSPEELRQQAVEQKNKYKILKGEGKSEEALQAFKSSKELERQAGALELALRKNRRMASKAVNVGIVADIREINDHEEPRSKKLPSQKVKVVKDDLASDLKELGWSDADLHDADNKPAKQMTLEGELLNLLGEIPKKSSAGNGQGGIDKTQVIVHKKKALTLKREGKLVEAKEELKRAKILEKQLEEQELLGEAEDSDDELSALIRSIKDDKQDDLLLDHAREPGLNFDHLLGAANDFALDGNFEITDDDMNNPDLVADLKSFGWSDDDDAGVADHVLQPSRLDLEASHDQILALKREALSQKRAGNVAESMTLLKKAKLLEKDLENLQSDIPISTSDVLQKSSTARLSSDPPVVRETDEENIIDTVKMPRKSKMMIQRELLNLKKKALALRREGHVEEAEEELKKGKILEQQLEEMENGPERSAGNFDRKVRQPPNADVHNAGFTDLTDDVEAEVTEQDMHDPDLLSVLEDLGWDGDTGSASVINHTSKTASQHSVQQNGPLKTPKVIRSKAVVQKELLGIKRNAFALRRQGKTQEAEDELERAKTLENELTEIENAAPVAKEPHEFSSFVPQEASNSQKAGSSVNKGNMPTTADSVQSESQHTEVLSSVLGSTQPATQVSVKANTSSEKEISLPMMSAPAMLDKPVKRITTINQSVTAEQNTPEFDAQRSEILVLKRNALALKREGKLVEAREELRRAKLLEKSLEDAQQSGGGSQNASASASESPPIVQEGKTNLAQKPVHLNSSGVQDRKTNQIPKPLTGRERFKVQQESLSHKRNALKLRREGKIAESEAEFELAKALESQLEELSAPGSSTGKPETKDDASVEDFLDPQLMSALKSIGWAGTDFAPQPSKVSEPKTKADFAPQPSKASEPKLNSEKAQLEEQIKSEKLRALNFKRGGKQTEALESLRAAKRLEKRLVLLTS